VQPDDRGLDDPGLGEAAVLADRSGLNLPVFERSPGYAGTASSAPAGAPGHEDYSPSGPPSTWPGPRFRDRHRRRHPQPPSAAAAVKAVPEELGTHGLGDFDIAVTRRFISQRRGVLRPRSRVRTRWRDPRGRVSTQVVIVNPCRDQLQVVGQVDEVLEERRAGRAWSPPTGPPLRGPRRPGRRAVFRGLVGVGSVRAGAGEGVGLSQRWSRVEPAHSRCARRKMYRGRGTVMLARTRVLLQPRPA
jgi:hypothetical protein